LIPLFSMNAQSAAIAANEKVEKQVVSVQIENPKATHIFVVGDSTFSPFNDAYFYPRYGIGTKIANYLKDNGKVEVVNLALSGRSSKSFLTEGNYKILQENIKKGDYLIIGFGHNDEKTEEARYTNPNGSKEEAGSFKNSLYENYVKLAQSKKATAVLCTPIVRRSPKGEYTGSNIHQTSDVEGFPGGDYAKAIRELASETGAILIDNTAISKALEEELGVAGSAELHAWLSHKEASVDNTHLNVYGASVMAYKDVQELASKDKKFKKLLAKEPLVPSDATKPLILEKNPSYIIPKYEAPTEASRTASFPSVTAPWFGTVFGDCGGPDHIADRSIYDIQKTSDTSFVMHSGNEEKSSGKIASGSDGIAFAFQKINANKDFTLTATANVKMVKSNNQVSFGLMVRDDAWIDKFDNSIKSNYVAAGPLKIAKAGDFSSSFARVDGALDERHNGGEAVPAAGQKVKLSLVKKGNVVTAKYGNDPAETFEVKLTEVDSGFIYVGLFTVRQCEVEFTDVNLSVN